VQPASVAKFLDKHGGRLLHLITGYIKASDFKLFDVCYNLVHLEFRRVCAIGLMGFGYLLHMEGVHYV
jgi:hypothetical protein